MTADARVGLVSVARCAELLTAAGDSIERSALSRYCDKHSLKQGRAKGTRVDFETVQAHRAANYTREVMSGRPVAPVLAPAALPLEAVAPPAPAGAVVKIPDRDDPARGLKEIQLRQAQRDEAEAEGRLTHVADVDAGAAEAIVEMRAAFAEARATAAEHLAAELGLPPEKVRTLRAAFKRYDRVGQDKFAARIARALQDVNRESPSDAQARLAALAALAVRLRAAHNPALAAEVA